MAVTSEDIYQYWREALDLILYEHEIPRNAKALENIAEQYIDSKDDIIDYFDDDLRLRREIDVQEESLAKDDLKTIKQNWLKRKGANLINKSKYNNLSKYKVIVNFLFSHLSLLDIEEIKDGRLHEKIELDNGNVLNKNTKLTKLIKYRLKNADDLFTKHEEEMKYGYLHENNYDLVLQYIYDMYSLILSSVKNIKGTVVLSINPIDYITMSEHTSGWSSCLNYKDGRYRYSILNYALSREVFVSYAYEIKDSYDYGSVNQSIDNMPVKKWRRLSYVKPEDGLAYFAPSYPMSVPIYDKFDRKNIGRFLAEYNNTEPVWNLIYEIYNSNRTTKTNEENKILEKSAYINIVNDIGYIDGVRSSISLENFSNYYENIDVAFNKVFCVTCGNEIESPHHCNSFQCKYCDDNIDICDNCGAPLHSYMESNYVEDEYGKVYCLECADRMETHQECESCHDLYTVENLNKITVKSEFGIDSNTEVKVCNGCLKNRHKKIDKQKEIYRVI